MYKKINLYPKLLRETNQPIDRLNASLSTEKKRSKLKLKRIKRRPYLQLIGYTKLTLNISLFLIILMQHLNKTWLFIDIVINIWFNFPYEFKKYNHFYKYWFIFKTGYFQEEKIERFQIYCSHHRDESFFRFMFANSSTWTTSLAIHK